MLAEEGKAMENPSLGPAASYKHDHPPIQNVNELVTDTMTVGQRIADRLTTTVGSWPFLIVQSVVLIGWITVNALRKAWDPYPFILLNLVLSFQAAYTGPIVMMSQNRQSYKDRLAAELDFTVNEKAETEIRILMDQLAHKERLDLTISQKAETEIRTLVDQVSQQAEQIQKLSQQLTELMTLLRNGDSGSPSLP